MESKIPPKREKAANFFKTGYKNPLGETIDILWRVDDWFRDIPKNQMAQFHAFHDELLKFNNSANLISVKTIATADATHFADSIIASKHIIPLVTNQELYDFGSGSGFPGMIFGIMFPKVQMKLVDSDGRKCDFLKHVVSKLNIQNVQVMNTHIENLPAGSIQFGVSRGLASISKSLMMMRKIFKKGGVLFHIKGEEWYAEVSGMPTQLCMYWKPALVAEYRLPQSEVQYSVVKTEKIAE